MATRIQQLSMTNTARQNVTVNSAPQGAGQTFAYTQSTTKATIFNTSAVGAVEYQLNALAWVPIPKNTAAIINCDLAVDVIKLRQVIVADGVTTVEISVESSPTSSLGGINVPLVIIGVAGVAPTNGDGRPDGTVYIY